MVDIATLGVKVESTGVQEGAAGLDKLAASAEKADLATQELAANSAAATKSLSGVGAAAASNADGLNTMSAANAKLAESEEAATSRIKAMVAASLEQKAAMNTAADAVQKLGDAGRKNTFTGFGAGGDSLAASFASQTKELEALNIALAQQGKSLADIAALKAKVGSLSSGGMLDKEEAAAAVTQLEKEAAGAAKVSDGLKGISLTSSFAMREYQAMVDGMARGNIGQVAREVGVMTVRTGALGAIMSPVGLAIGGVAAALAVFAAAAYQASNENLELQKAVILSGTAAGVSADQLSTMAKSMSEISGTRGAAVDALSALASTGKVAGSNLEAFASTAENLKDTIGQPLAATANIFAELGKSPVEASKKLNEQYGYLTASVFNQIIALQKQGDIEAAGEVAQKAYADAADQRTKALKEQMGTLQTVAAATGGFFKKMWDDIKGGVTPDTFKEQLDDLLKRRADFQTQLANLDKQDPGNKDSQTKIINGNIAFLDQQIAATQKAADADKAAADAQSELTKANKEYEAELPTINALLKDRIAFQEALAKATLGSSIADIQRELNATKNAYSNYNSILEELHSAQLVSDEDFYAARAQVIVDGANDEVKKINEEIAKVKAANSAAHAAFNAQDHFDPVETQKATEAQTLQDIAVQKQLNDLYAQRTDVIAKAATAVELNGLKQTDASNKEIKAFAEATAAAQKFLDVQNNQQNRTLNGLGKGDAQRQRDAGLNAIEDQYAQQRLELQRNKKPGDDGQKEYDQQLSVINEFQKKAVDSYGVYYDALTAKQSDWSVGAQEAIANYFDSSANLAKQTDDLFTHAFTGMEDALISFVQTGKLNFKQFADSVVADLLRIQIRALATKIFTSFLGGSAPSGGTAMAGGTDEAGGGGAMFAANGAAFDHGQSVSMFANGGIVDQPTGFSYNGGKAGVMGEAGPEGILPLRRNAKGQLGVMGGGGTNVTMNNTYNFSENNNVAQLQTYMDKRDKQLSAQIVSDINRGVYGKVGK